MNRALFPVDGLEDDAAALFAGGAAEADAVQLSIAISLTRIADALSRSSGDAVSRELTPFAHLPPECIG